jgi:hypothetical protein
VAITRNGRLFQITTSAATEISGAFANDRLATGALAVWQGSSNSILLVGRQDPAYSTSTGYTHGYMEFVLNTEGGISGPVSFKEPGDAPSTIIDKEVYVSSLGKIPVNHIFQASTNVDEDRTLFASTQKDGVWSLRQHDVRPPNPHWNAESQQ